MTRPLFPRISPFKEQLFPVSDGHSLYLEQSGNPNGIPALYLHGGPGSGCNEHHRRYFDPNQYHIICFDQRGCGRSQPSPSLNAVDMNSYIQDIEAIRQHLNIDQWLVVCGGWGASLALVYATEYAERLSGMILRSASLLDEDSYSWKYSNNGVARFFPEYYRVFSSFTNSDDQAFDNNNEKSLLNKYIVALKAKP